MSSRKRQTNSSSTTTTTSSTPPPTTVAFDVDQPKPIITRTLSGRQSKILQRRARYSKSPSALKPFWQSPVFQGVVALSTVLLMYLAFRVSSGLDERILQSGKGPSAVKSQPVKLNPKSKTTQVRYGEPAATSSVNDVARLFVVKDVGGKGKGTVAARDIKRGERILVDKPLIKIPRDTPSIAAENILDQVNTLTEDQLNAFLSLSYHHTVALADGTQKEINPQEADMPLAIVQTNALAVEGGMLGVFPRAARMNHGCAAAFNAVHSWREEEGELHVHALKDIMAGEEILLSYTDTKQPRSDRQAFLLMHYHFDCACPVCSLPQVEADESDARLLKIHNLYKKLNTWTEDKIDGIEAIRIVNEIWETGDEEGYTGERAQLASNAGLISTAHSDVESARTWYMLAAQAAIYEFGADSPRVTELMRLAGATESTTYPSWAAKETMHVGGPKSKYGFPDLKMFEEVRGEGGTVITELG
ncbi:hypothetical protein FRB95_006702 [Tulasnella sp. JGI-2019a]|nr:hypothetical protein FRB95_006702 [Tulasnella sp. JGI-2019a]